MASTNNNGDSNGAWHSTFWRSRWPHTTQHGPWKRPRAHPSCFAWKRTRARSRRPWSLSRHLSTSQAGNRRTASRDPRTPPDGGKPHGFVSGLLRDYSHENSQESHHLMMMAPTWTTSMTIPMWMTKTTTPQAEICLQCRGCMQPNGLFHIW